MRKPFLKLKFLFLALPALLGARTLSVEGTSGSPAIEFQGIRIDHFDLPGLELELCKELVPYLDLPWTEETLFCLKKTIAAFFKREGKPLVFVDTSICEDDHLHVQIQEGRLGQIRVSHNRWVSASSICRQIRLCSDEPLDSELLLQDLRWLCRSPFQEIDAIFTPGEKPYTADIELLARDRFPLRGFTSVDNTGVVSTGRTRYVAGLQAAPFFNHLLTYQFSTGNSYPDFHSHFLQYTWPFSWRNWLDLYGAYECTQSGRSTLGSARYTIPTAMHAPWSVWEFTLGFDFKQTQEDLCQRQTVNLTQFLASLQVGAIECPHEFLLTANLYGSPGNLTGKRGSKSHFETFRTDASNRYLYLNTAFYYAYTLPAHFLWTLNLRGQLSSTNLLPSEQFGLGGFSSVRGYNEFQAVTDNALLINTELRSPLLPLLDRFHLRDYDEGLQLLFFLDSGLGCNHKKERALKSFHSLTGIGPGLRYSIDPYFSLRLDWGLNLNQLFGDKSFKSRLHFAVFLNLW